MPETAVAEKPVKKRNTRALIVLLVILIPLVLLYGRPVIQNDGITYYALTLSLVRDHDFDLTNQNQELRDLRVMVPPAGKPASIIPWDTRCSSVPYFAFARAGTLLR